MRGNLGIAAAPNAERRQRHFDALDNPNDTERPFVLLMEAAVLLAEKRRTGVVFGPAAVLVLCGLQVLLGASDCGRLDRRIIDALVRQHTALCCDDSDGAVSRGGVSGESA